MWTTRIRTTGRYVDNRNPDNRYVCGQQVSGQHGYVDNRQICGQQESEQQVGMWTTGILTTGRYVDNSNPDNR
jgi:hypothetical protein